MAGIFRSEPMQFVRLTMNSEIAPDCVRALGNMAKFHIIDVCASAPRAL
jgi:hypothetical protein